MQQAELIDAVPTRFPGKHRRYGTNWGICNKAGEWLFSEVVNILAFDRKLNAQEWLANPTAFSKDRQLSFKAVEHSALVQ